MNPTTAIRAFRSGHHHAGIAAVACLVVAAVAACEGASGPAPLANLAQDQLAGTPSPSSFLRTPITDSAAAPCPKLWATMSRQCHSASE